MGPSYQRSLLKLVLTCSSAGTSTHLSTVALLIAVSDSDAGNQTGERTLPLAVEMLANVEAGISKYRPDQLVLNDRVIRK